MELLIPASILQQLRSELRNAGRREVGGVLFGEHIGQSVFRIVELSVQRSGGTQTTFVRDPELNREQLEAFFQRTGDDHARFNYLGEWHSHPSFSVTPSGEDEETMSRLLKEELLESSFVLLVIVRGDRETLAMSATAYTRAGERVPAMIYLEAVSDEQKRRGYRKL